MGFSSYDDLIAEMTAGKYHRADWFKNANLGTGVANSWASMWVYPGWPPAGFYFGTALEGTLTNDSSLGAILHGGNKSPDTKHITFVSGMATAATAIMGNLLIYDRLLYYPTISASSTSPQSLTNPSAITRYTNGKGVQAWLEVTTAFGSGTGTFTMDYTSDEGSGNALGRATITAASSIIGRIPHVIQGQANTIGTPFLPLAAGTSGVKSVQSVEFTAAHASGVCALVLGYPLAWIPLTQASVLSERELAMQINSLPRVYDGACLQVLHYHQGALVNPSAYMGTIQMGWG
jgi:hypothetical protein